MKKISLWFTINMRDIASKIVHKNVIFFIKISGMDILGGGRLGEARHPSVQVSQP